MAEVLGDLLDYCTLIWVDDIFQYAKDFQGLLKNLPVMFSRIKDRNVYLNPTKSVLCSSSVTWCGRRIDSIGVNFDDTLVQGLIDFERPKSAQQLQHFIGACK
jgi:hypothetical protein